MPLTLPTPVPIHTLTSFTVSHRCARHNSSRSPVNPPPYPALGSCSRRYFYGRRGFFFTRTLGSPCPRRCWDAPVTAPGTSRPLAAGLQAHPLTPPVLFTCIRFHDSGPGCLWSVGCTLLTLLCLALAPPSSSAATVVCPRAFFTTWAFFTVRVPLVILLLGFAAPCARVAYSSLLRDHIPSSRARLLGVTPSKRPLRPHAKLGFPRIQRGSRCTFCSALAPRVLHVPRV